MRIFTPLLRRVARLFKSENGNVTIEFVILFPAFMFIFLSAVESGVLMTRQVMLERALDMTVRDLRLGVWQEPTQLGLKQRVCNIAGIIPDCMNSILVELRPVSTETWSPLNTAVTCVDRDAEIQPVVTIDQGVDHEMMLVRVCSMFKPFLPTSGLGLQLGQGPHGEYALVSSSAFVNEPS